VTGRSIAPITPVIGAMVAGVDLSDDLDGETVAWLRAALVEHLVLFFRDQDLTPEEQHRFAQRFAPVLMPYIDSPSTEVPGVTVLDQTNPRGVSTEHWHCDSTNLAEPPMAGLLHAVMVPSSGGDTCWASMVAAFEGLSAPMQQFLKGLRAQHSTAHLDAEMARYPHVVRRDQGMAPSHHPVVRKHPESGRSVLFVNRNFTDHIDGLSEAESDTLLAMLYRQISEPEFHVRFRWERGSVALWDNRATQHCAIADYSERRILNRCIMVGDRPVAAA
jgi:taurine dioxygenase